MSNPNDPLKVTIGAVSALATFNDGALDANGCRWYVDNIDGWDSPNMRQTLQPRAGAHGSYIGDSFHAERPLVVTGWVECPDSDTVWAARALLAKATDLTDIDGTLTVYEPAAAGGTKYLKVRRSDRVKFAQNQGLDIVEFQIPLVAAEPRKLTVVQHAIDAVVAAGDTFVDHVQMPNLGDVEVEPVITLTGTGDTFWALSVDWEAEQGNPDAQHLLFVNADLTGHTFVVDVPNRALYMDGALRMDLLRGDYQWFRFWPNWRLTGGPGNYFIFTRGGTTGTATAHAVYSDGYS